MCGHFGMATLAPTLLVKERGNIMFDGIYTDALRGFDSTGIAFVFDGKDAPAPRLLKRAIPAADYLTTSSVVKAFKKLSTYTAMIGHNRAATIGRVVDDAAHPYQHCHITLAHNGTLDWDTNLDGSFETDSEEVAYTMAKTNELETLERINGAYALVWHNAEDNTINFARNKERPFSFATSKDGKHLFWASESGMLAWILKRNNVDYETIWNINPGKHFKFKLDATSFSEHTITEFTPYVKPTAYSGNYSGSSAVYAKTPEERLREVGVDAGDYVGFIVRPNDIQLNGNGSANKTYRYSGETLLKKEISSANGNYDVAMRGAMYSITEKEHQLIRDVMFRDNKAGEPVVAYALANTIYALSSTQMHSYGGKNQEIILNAGSHFVLDTLANCKAAGLDPILAGGNSAEKKNLSVVK